VGSNEARRALGSALRAREASHSIRVVGWLVIFGLGAALRKNGHHKHITWHTFCPHPKHDAFDTNKYEWPFVVKILWLTVSQDAKSSPKSGSFFACNLVRRR